MKRISVIIAVFLLGQVANTYGQAATTCGWKIPPRSVLTSRFASVYEARDIVNTMLDTIKWKENFVLKEQNGINNAYATIVRNQRWIVYDNTFLENIDTYAATKWASISIMAHEMGHHYYNHVVSATGSTLPKEIEADAFSGYVMSRMGATLDQSVAAMSKIASDRASQTHPGKADRLAAITRGWNQAKAEREGTVNNNGNNGNGNNGNGNNGNNGNNGSGNPGTSTVGDPTWIGLSMQSNKAETVYLSDDGKTYQPAEIKVGEPFVFKFEIYNYGWLRLPYYNGYRTFKLTHGLDYAIVWNRRNKNWTVVQVPE